MVLPTLELEHMDCIYQSLSQSFADLDSQLQIFSASSDFDVQVQLMDQLDAKTIGGAIIPPPPLNQYAPAMNNLAKRGIPVVQLAYHLKGATTDAVAVDGTEIGRLGFDHLLEKGHRRIGMVNMQTDYSTFSNLEMGADMALRSYGMTFDQVPQAFVSPTDLHTQSDLGNNGQKAANYLLAKYPDLTAIVGINRYATLGIYRAVTERGLQVGKDISILSLAGDLQYFQATTPTISAIVAPLELITQRAAVRLQQIMDRDAYEEPQIITLAPKLIERQSVYTRPQLAPSF